MKFPFTSEQLTKLHARIETPALIVWQPNLEKNIADMQALANRFDAALRPHTKTHKSPLFAQWQLNAGAKGITVAKLSEAEVMAAHGIDDIFIANQITQVQKLKRLRKLHERIHLTVGLDNPRQIDLLRPFFKDATTPLNVRIEIDSGLKRCGVTVGNDLVELAKAVARQPFLRLDGIFTHAGHVYAARSAAQVEAIGKQEGALMAGAKTLLQKNGLRIATVSVGSTPTVPFSVRNPAVNEVRPGNYVFYDAMQIALHAAAPEQVSLFVLSTVVAHPVAGRLVIDAGSKALHTDGAGVTGHFGLPVNIKGKVVRLSEEHGVLELPEESTLRLGDPVLLVPNHACAVANLFDVYYLINEALQIKTVPVEARGKSQ